MRVNDRLPPHLRGFWTFSLLLATSMSAGCAKVAFDRLS